MATPARHVVGDQRRHPDAEVHVVAVLHLRGDPAHDALAPIHVDDLTRALLDAPLVAFALEDALHEDARGVHGVGVDLARLDQLLDLGDRDARGHGHHRGEVARGLAVDQVAVAVALPGLHEREVGLERQLEHVRAAVDTRVSLPSATSVP